MKLTYKGKTAIVTGASGGMGLECVKQLEQNNIKVLMLDIKEPPINFLKKNTNIQFKKIDLTKFKNLNLIINQFYLKHKTVDYLVNTTGVLLFGKDIAVVDIDFDHLIKTLWH